VPAHDLADAKGVITTVQGVVSALLAIVVGLLIWTSYGVFTQQQSEAATLAAQLVLFDVLLDRLGPEGTRGRELMRRELIAARKRFWGDGEISGPRPATRRRERSWAGWMLSSRASSWQEERSRRGSNRHGVCRPRSCRRIF
jgi:hypothetical protein